METSEEAPGVAQDRANGRSPGVLTAATLPVVLDRIRVRLEEHRDEIDALNVFPVPDGDTGSNLLATVDAATDAARGTDGAVTDAARDGALRGACGNSGVILSQVIRAVTETLEQQEDHMLGVDGLRVALARGRDLAYEAVADPVEGTMLTALDAAAARAAEMAPDETVSDAVGAVVDAVSVAVARTREQLPAARAAGVVDAGARGLEVVLAAVHEHLTGVPHALPPAPHHRDGDGHRPVTERESGSTEYSFEVQYLLRGSDGAASDLRGRLGDLGDSVVVVASGGVVKVHVHVNDVGAAIEAGRRHGVIEDIEVATFADAVEPGERSRPPPSRPAELLRLGVVTVAPGEGIRDVAERAGAVVVHGASGDLPNVAMLLEAVGEVDAERVVILPGHRNIVPTAQQAAEISDAEGGRSIDVVETATSVPAVLAALAVMDPGAEPERTLAVMRDATEHVRAGEVVTAVRSADTPAGSIEEGQLLAVVDGAVVGIADGPVEAVRALIECCDDGAEVITLVVGAEVGEAERADVRALIEDAADAEVVVLDGRQRPARYLLGFE